jgi:hypothetical protein
MKKNLLISTLMLGMQIAFGYINIAPEAGSTGSDQGRKSERLYSERKGTRSGIPWGRLDMIAIFPSTPIVANNPDCVVV